MPSPLPCVWLPRTVEPLAPTATEPGHHRLPEPFSRVPPLPATPRARIGVLQGPTGAELNRLLTAWEELLPVEFVPIHGPADGVLDAALLIDPGAGVAEALADRGVPSLSVPAPGRSMRRSYGREVHFAKAQALPPVLRGERLRENRPWEALPLAPLPEELCLAFTQQGPLWVHCPGGDGRGSRDRSAIPLPSLGPADYLRDHLNEDSFLGVLPALDFLRRLTRDRDWSRPPPRACFIFDDPNLRHPIYGHLDFTALARHTREQNYHAAIGLIPLDMTMRHSQVVAAFRGAPGHLSLAIHGNDHTRLELAREGSDLERRALCAQAIERTEEFERQTGLTVCRVMEPPFGVLLHPWFAALREAGFAGVLVTPGQFLPWNPDHVFPPSFGLGTAECLPGGLALLPRIRMAPSWRTEVRLAQFLDQPVVLAGHHRDAREDLSLLTSFAEVVNTQPQVQWGPLREIARAHVRSRQFGGVYHLSMRASHVSVDIPHGVHLLQVERPWLPPDHHEALLVRLGGREFHRFPAQGSVTEIPIVSPGAPMELRSEDAAPGGTNPAPRPHRRLWPRVRRRLTEIRDRLYPIVHTA